MKIKFNSADELTLNKRDITIMTIVVRAIFLDNNKYFQPGFLDECLNEI